MLHKVLQHVVKLLQHMMKCGNECAFEAKYDKT